MRGQAIPDPGKRPEGPPARQALEDGDWRAALPTVRGSDAPEPARPRHPYSDPKGREFDRNGARAKLFVLWNALGLDDERRYEFTGLFLGIEDGDVSWRTITNDQMCRLIDAMEGYALLNLMMTEDRR